MQENKTIVNVPQKTKFKEFMESGWDLLKFAIMALVIVVPIRMWVAQPFVVSGESMFPTFDNGQYLIVDEISYILGHVNRGDVVIFRYPNDKKRFFIKRIIGLPNETVKIEKGKVTIFPCSYLALCDISGLTPLDEPYINEPFDTTETYSLGKDEYFVMGDNRNRSSDSRSWGILPKKLMIGRAFLRLLPFSEISYLPGEYKQK